MLRFLLICLACLGFSRPSLAQSTVPDLSEIVQIDLIQGGPDGAGAHLVAIRIDLAEGWKTYWRVAGDTGLPPVFDWQASQNLASVAYHWPRPEIIHAGDMKILGYEHQLILPVTLKAADPAQPVTANVSLDIGVCRDICIPVHADLIRELEDGQGPDSLLIDVALADQPLTAEAANLREISCKLQPAADGFRLSVSLDLPRLAGGEELVSVETGNGDIWTAPVRGTRSATGLAAEIDLLNYSGQPVTLDPSAFVVTVIGAQSAVAITGCPAG